MKTLEHFLLHNKPRIIEEWISRMHTELGEEYAKRPRVELLENTGEAFEAFFHVLVNGDFSHIDRFIDRITLVRLEAGFQLSEVQKAFELYRTIVIPLLAKETPGLTLQEFSDLVIDIDQCMAYAIHRFSDHFQDMHEQKTLENSRRLEEAQRLAELGTIANRIAHELRNPLTIVGGFSRRQYDKMAADDPGKRYLEIVVEAVKALECNISNIIKIGSEE